MPTELLRVRALLVNRANDRHGQMQDEDHAIAELFRLREAHMRNLALDIEREGRLYEHPLVRRAENIFVVYDGNRRITCLKLILEPHRAPTVALQNFFQQIQDRWEGDLIEQIECQVEEDLEVIDSILFRRHTGAQGGVGQSPWDNRAKRNFQERTGRNERIDVAQEIERVLEENDLSPDRPIPRSTLNRLLSSEANRARLGVSALNGEFRLTHEPDVVIRALARVANDLSERRVVLANVWSNEDKRRYLDRLEGEALLPRADDFVAAEAQRVVPAPQPVRRRREIEAPRAQTTFIPQAAAGVNWTADQQRLRLIWEELETLNIQTYPNAISALMRILLELTVESYINHHDLNEGNSLAQRVGIVCNHLRERGAIDQNYYDELERVRRGDELISIQSMQRFIHSQRFAPMPNELLAYWLRLGDFVVLSLNR